MFDVSLFELALIALVALLVLGPQRLPRAARTVGLYVRKARQSWYSVRADIERELAADDLKRSIARSSASTRSAIERELGVDDIARDLKATDAALREPAAPTSPPRDEPPAP
jgi:sec-independent protein translocase protein TatB